MPTEFRDCMEQRTEEWFKSLTKDAGQFLHFDLDGSTHTKDQVKTMVQCIPESLSEECFHMNEDDGGEYCVDEDTPEESLLPIQAACLKNRKAAPFILLLAEEGMKHNVGGEGTTGGLWRGNWHFPDLLVRLVYEYSGRSEDGEDSSPGDHDLLLLDVIKTLWKTELLKKEEIRKYDLLTHACCPRFSKKRFEYLVDCDPDALKQKINAGPYDCLLHWLVETTNQYWQVESATSGDHVALERFKMAFTGGLKHFPLELGLLYQENSNSKSVIEAAYNRFGKEKAWKAIEDCLGRKDTKTNDCSLMVAAAEGSSSHLDVIYYMLRKEPVVLEHSMKLNKMSPADNDVIAKRQKLG